MDGFDFEAAAAGEFDDAIFDLLKGGLLGFALDLAAAVVDGGEDAAGAAVANQALGQGEEEIVDEFGEGFSGSVGDLVGVSAPVGAEVSPGVLRRGDAATVGLEARVVGVMVAAVAGALEGGRLALVSVVEKIHADCDHR